MQQIARIIKPEGGRRRRQPSILPAHTLAAELRQEDRKMRQIEHNGGYADKEIPFKTLLRQQQETGQRHQAGEQE